MISRLAASVINWEIPRFARDDIRTQGFRGRNGDSHQGTKYRQKCCLRIAVSSPYFKKSPVIPSVSEGSHSRKGISFKSPVTGRQRGICLSYTQSFKKPVTECQRGISPELRKYSYFYT